MSSMTFDIGEKDNWPQSVTLTLKQSQVITFEALMEDWLVKWVTSWDKFKSSSSSWLFELFQIPSRGSRDMERTWLCDRQTCCKLLCTQCLNSEHLWQFKHPSTGPQDMKCTWIVVTHKACIIPFSDAINVSVLTWKMYYSWHRYSLSKCLNPWTNKSSCKQ